MATALINHKTVAGATSGTTAAFDRTGATLIVIGLSRQAVGRKPTDTEVFATGFHLHYVTFDWSPE